MQMTGQVECKRVVKWSAISQSIKTYFYWLISTAVTTDFGSTEYFGQTSKPC